MEDADRNILGNQAYPSIQCQDRIYSLYEAHPTISFENLFSKAASQKHKSLLDKE